MELKRYLGMLLRRWWLILIGFVVVFSATLFLTLRQPNIYEAKATFVMRPRSEFIVEDDFVRALDVVSRRVEINTTFAEVVGSKLIKNQAIEQLELTSTERKGLSVNGRVIGGTNILEVTVKGQNPDVVQVFANMVGELTVDYVSNLYDVFELEPLDAATRPSKPVSPNLMLNLGLGVVFGLAFGVGLVFAFEYLSTTHSDHDTFNIIDRESGTYNKSYLMHRLWQEMSRSKRNQRPLAMGMIKIDIGDTDEEDVDYKQIEALRLVKLLAEKVLRPEDVMARFDDNTVAILLPEMTELEAQAFMEALNKKIESVPKDIGGHDALMLRSTVSAVSYDNFLVKQEKFRDEAARIFEEALLETENRR